jgi:hypothetical protein
VTTIGLHQQVLHKAHLEEVQRLHSSLKFELRDGEGGVEVDAAGKYLHA